MKERKGGVTKERIKTAEERKNEIPDINFNKIQIKSKSC
jgi:hypothetical protein